MGRTSGERGRAAFEARYGELFGQRWTSIKAALEGPGASRAFVVAEGSEPYFLDAASVAVAEFLPLDDGEILDACAAPGGKSLVLASHLSDGGRILANELSSDRRRRLAVVLDRHLPAGLRERVIVSGGDAAAMCRRNEGRFSSILLDAPCSSERHVMSDPKALEEWSPARPASLARRQWALLSSAFIMLRIGGSLVYSTCALSPEENEDVVARLAKKAGPTAVFEAPPGVYWEPRRYGAAVLPDRAEGAGPMYAVLVRKLGPSIH
ncbi:MAG TPA: 16S rRNA methyltransferase [Rectinemataceae bacterium]|nr:16S rRNA methyltransferase [Rectinemataceae bacterium]